jgi:hypothetical protein
MAVETTLSAASRRTIAAPNPPPAPETSAAREDRRPMSSMSRATGRPAWLYNRFSSHTSMRSSLATTPTGRYPDALYSARASLRTAVV